MQWILWCREMQGEFFEIMVDMHASNDVYNTDTKASRKEWVLSLYLYCIIARAEAPKSCSICHQKLVTG